MAWHCTRFHTPQPSISSPLNLSPAAARLDCTAFRLARAVAGARSVVLFSSMSLSRHQSINRSISFALFLGIAFVALSVVFRTLFLSVSRPPSLIHSNLLSLLLCIAFVSLSVVVFSCSSSVSLSAVVSLPIYL